MPMIGYLNSGGIVFQNSGSIQAINPSPVPNANAPAGAFKGVYFLLVGDAAILILLG